MPKPNKDEKKKDFISRCIPIVLDEGTAENSDQAAAICYGLWDEHMKTKKSELRAFDLNSSGRAHAVALAEAGQVDRAENWIFNAEDADAILGENNWTEYARWFLGKDSTADAKTKEHYKYPFGKDGKLYRSALVAIRQRAAQANATAILDAANALLEKIDGPIAKKARPDNMEYRTYVSDMKYDEEKREFVGHASVFNVEAGPTYFREMVAPGAFRDTIEVDDIRALFNHDPNYVLGRNRAGTLSLAEDEIGLASKILPPETQWAKDLAVSMNRGDITQMSFGFVVEGEEWIKGDEATGKPDVRILKRVKLFDVSIVTYPFYPDTDVAVRSWQEFREGLKIEKERKDRHELDLLERSLRIKQKKARH